MASANGLGWQGSTERSALSGELGYPRRATRAARGVSRETFVETFPRDGAEFAVEARPRPRKRPKRSLDAVDTKTPTPNAGETQQVTATEDPAASTASRPTTTGRGTVSRETTNSTVSRETTVDAAMPRPTRTRTIVIANQKGGVGKTTTAVNLAVALAQGGLKVLLCDLDPQGNASTALNIPHQMGVTGSYEVLLQGAPIAEHVVASPEADGLMVLPATIDLAGAELELVSLIARERQLVKALRAYLRDHQTDYVLIDCPPSLGLLTVNALVAADEILIPIQCEYYALEGLTQLMHTINLVKGDLNERLQLGAVLLTMYDARTRLSAQVAQEVRNHFSAQTLEAIIPRSVRVSEAPSYGQTVMTYDPLSVGSKAYRRAAAEIARRGAASEEN